MRGAGAQTHVWVVEWQAVPWLGSADGDGTIVGDPRYTQFTETLQQTQNAGRESNAAMVTNAKIELARRLQAILDDTRSADKGIEVSGIRDNVLSVADQLISALAKGVLAQQGVVQTFDAYPTATTVEGAQQQILEVVRQLESEGVLSLKGGGGSEYVV